MPGRIITRLVLFLAIFEPFLRVLAQAQTPAMVTTTSCRTWPLAPYSPPTQVFAKPTDAPPSLTSLCATTTRPARVSLIAEQGVWANVFNYWGGCNQSIEFSFNDSWQKYEFGVSWYDDPGAGCTGTPTASMTVSQAVTTKRLIKVWNRDQLGSYKR